nr:hypothetical protein [Tanacetum cinerariifolium]
MSVLATAEEKINKKIDVKARSLLLMALPNEHQLTFSQYNDAKTMFAAIKTQFGDVKRSVGTSTGAQNMAFMIAPSTSSTNDVNTANPAYEASTVSPNINTTSPQVSTANFSDNVVYAFMVENPNGSNLLKQDLEQIHKDDLEAMDLRWKLSLSPNLDEFKEPKFKGYGPRDSKLESNINHDQKSDDSKETSDDSFVKEQVLEDTSSFVESPLNVDKETTFSIDKKIEFVKPKNDDKVVRKSVRYAEMYRSQRPRGNQRNWNGQKSNQLGSDFVMYNKACFICKSFDHVQINCTHHQRKRRVSGNNYNMVDSNYYARTTHPSIQRNMTPRAVLLKTGLRPFNTARHVYNAHPKSIGKPQNDDKGFIDSECSRHMTENIAYLLYFKEFNRGYITFRRGAHGGRISGKGTLKTDCLDFENIYFVNELKFNLFNVSQMCDKKNYVLFTNTECLVLSPNFKLPDESQILLKIPRKDNMYSYDIKNIVSKESLTCLVAKATLDESLLWHKRLSHINFKNINKLVHDNLVRGLPIKHFENDQTCVAYLKGKQHIASSTKDKTSEILKNFIEEIENLVDKKVKIIRCDNGTKFKNKVMDEICIEKGKFDGKSDEGFFVRYSLSSKAFRVYNTRTRKVEENLHIGFLENKPMIEGNGLKWLFDIDSLTQSMNYVPVATGIISDESADASYFDTPLKDVEDVTHNENDDKDKSEDDSSCKEVNAAGQHVNTTSLEVNNGRFELNNVDPSLNTTSSSDPHSPTDMFKLGTIDILEATHVEFFSGKDALEVDLANIRNSYGVPTTSHTRIHKYHPIENVISEVQSFVQTRRMTKPTSEKGFLSAVYEEKTHVTLNTCLYAYFLSHIEPTSIAKPLSDSSWVEAIQEELLQFKLQQVWILVDLPYGKKAIGTKWVFRNKKDERGIVIRNKARLVAQGHRQEERIDYEEFFAPMVSNREDRSNIVYQEARRRYFASTDLYVKSASTPVDLEKPLVKDGDANDVDVHLYRSMIGSLMYLTTSRPDNMFAVYACLWYPRDSPFELVAYTDSDYARSTQDKKSTSDGFQFLGNRLISCQCKKQTVVVTSTTEAKYVAVASCCRQVLWIQNQLLDYGHHFIRDCNTKKLIQMVKIHTDLNVVDLLTKGFAAGRISTVRVSVNTASVNLILKFKRGQDIKIPQPSGPPKKAGDEVVHKELGDRMERAATTASSLEVEQDSEAQTRFEAASKQFNDPPP